MENKTCGECRYYVCNRHGGCCTFIGDAMCDDDLACDNFEKPTNGDVIRQGGDEALMLFKKKHKCDCCVYIRSGNCTEPVDRKDRCADGLKQWLNAPAETERD